MKSKRPLTVYGICIHRLISDPILENFPKATNCAQLRAIVATHTKKEAAELLGISVSHLSEYGSVSGNEEQIAIATAKPGQIFAKPITDYSDKYVEIARTPYMAKRRFLRSDVSAEVFTSEELETIIDHFAESDDPVGQSIASKAREMMKLRGPNTTL